jgi:Ca2+-binding RTX toxin-like protein
LKEEFEEWFSQGVETLEFADGTTWTRADLRLKWLAQSSTAGNDTIVGFSGADSIQGGTGNDVLSGSNGADTYIYAAGDGTDVIDDQGGSGANSLVLQGIAPSNVTIVHNANDAILLIGDHGAEGRITIRQQFNSPTSRISSITFDDGTIWTDQTIAANAIANDGTIVTHYGSAGDDTIWGTSDIDVIDGAAGTDTLQGEGGSDTYRWGSGYGNDTVVETSANSGTDTIRLVGLNPADVTLVRAGSDLRIQLNASGETLKVQNQFNGTNGIEQLVFADGTAWDRGAILVASWIVGTSAAETIYGTADAETFDGLAGNDNLRGGGNGDTYIYRAGSGNDTVSEFSSDAGNDKVKLVGLNAADVEFSRNNNDLFIKIIATSEVLKVENQFNGTNGVEQVAFDDGTTWDRSQIFNAAWVRLTSGNDSYYGSSDAETLDGRGGNDYLQGRGGGDTYIFGAGSGNDTVAESSADSGSDVVKLINLNGGDVEFSRVNNDLFIKIVATSEVLKVENQFNGANGIEQVMFGDGTVWDRTQISEAAWVRGTAGAETLNGNGNAETFDGRGGNDTLRGYGSGDTYIYSIGAGNDTIAEYSGDAGNDVVKLTSLNASDIEFSRISNDLFIKIVATSEVLKVENQFNGTNGIEQVMFGDGTAWDRTQIADAAWVRGTSGAETLNGNGNAETFDGRGGNDTLRGYGNGDTYIYALGSGNDIVEEYSGDAGTDVVKLAGLNSADVLFSRSGNDLFVQINASGETVKVSNQFNGTNGVEQFVFADGTSWDRPAIASAAWYRGTSGNDTISGSSSNDTIAGGGGNDTMSGGSGNDTFVFRTNSGQDTVADFTPGQDVLEFGDGLFADAAAALAAATASGNNTIITIDAYNSVLLQNVSLANLHESDFHIV